MNEFDVIVLGAGAAGLYCAAEAGRRGRRAVVLEHNDRPGRKILISGGGRCNFTNRETRPERFLSENPDFCRSALARFTPADFIALIERHGVPYYEKKLGQLFCRTSAKAVTDLLLAECREAGAEVRVGCGTEDVAKEGGAFRLRTNRGEFAAPALVVATGGLSI
ncbi:MAG: NAD(P)/FAD-dependent oxidoreductase, partial [Candidatus Methylomirabilis sp.]|nr:NAD(P)/FAD-dependent oxidoreductase [Deltaproteobacteria bacterium]